MSFRFLLKRNAYVGNDHISFVPRVVLDVMNVGARWSEAVSIGSFKLERDIILSGRDVVDDNGHIVLKNVAKRDAETLNRAISTLLVSI